MLNGIGGRTVAEAKERMSDHEFANWCAYIRKRGTLNLGTRVEMGFALLAMVTRNSAGGKSKIDDFLPKRDEKGPTDDMHGLLTMFKAKAAETNSALKRQVRAKRRFKRGK